MRKKRTLTLLIVSTSLLFIAYFMCFAPALYSVSDPIAGQTHTSFASIYSCIFGDMFNFGSLSAFVLMTISFIFIGLAIYFVVKEKEKYILISLSLSSLLLLVAAILFFLVLNFLTFRNVTPYIGFGSIFVGVLCLCTCLINIANIVLNLIKK